MRILQTAAIWLSVAGLAFSRGPKTVPSKEIGVGASKHIEWLVVDLAVQNNTEIVATVFNFSPKDVKALAQNNFLDGIPVRKVGVRSEAGEVKFDGMFFSYSRTGNHTEAEFFTIPAQSVIQIQFDLAEMYDLSRGGIYTVEMSGNLETAEKKGTKIVGRVPYWSNELRINVDGPKAKKARAGSHGGPQGGGPQGGA